MKREVKRPPASSLIASYNSIRMLLRLALVTLLAPSAFAQSYVVEPLEPAGSFSLPSVDGLLADGTSVGWAQPSGFEFWQAVRYLPGGYELLPPLPGEVGSRAYGTSPSGIVCGSSVRLKLIGGQQTPTLFETAVAWDASQTAIDLEAAATSGDTLDLFSAVDADDTGRIVGRGRELTLGVSRGFVFEAGHLTAIGPLPGQPVTTGADVKAISPSGLVVGFAQTGTGDHAFTWLAGSYADLHNTGGVGGLSSHAIDVNPAGVVVGSADPSNDIIDTEVACRWAPGQPVEYLGTLGGLFSRALGVNAAGDIVGWSWTATGGTSAFLWRAGTLHDLNSMIAPGWSVAEARKIGDDGTIIAMASENGGPFVPVQLHPQLGTAYCSSSANSTGFPATIEAIGSASIAANDFSLRAAPVPPTPGIFFYGPNAVQIPFGNGVRCVGGAIFRLPPVTVSTGGALLRPIDNTQLAPGGGFAAGQTWRFQAWFRDSAAGGAGFDLSDGLEVVFGP